MELNKKGFQIYKLFNIILPSFIIVIYMLIIYKITKLYPFGNRSISWLDMTQMVVARYCNFKDILQGHGSLFLDFKSACGFDNYPTLISLFLSPINYLVLFIPKSDIIMFMNVLFMLKIAVAALTASCCFYYINRRLYSGFRVLLSVMYAFCGYGLIYYQNIIFITVMELFPLLVIAVYRLVVENKPIMYLIVLSLYLFYSYYFSYMIAIFLLLFIGIYILSKSINTKHPLPYVKIFVYSVIPVLLTAFVWLPSIIQTAESGRVGNGMFISISKSDILTPYQTAIPMLFCSAFIWIVLLSDIIRNKAKLHTIYYLSLIMTGIMLIPYLLEPINKMWHIGQYMCFPCRFGFIPIFLSLLCCSFVLQEQPQYKNNLIISIILTIVSCFAVYCCLKYLMDIRRIDANNISRSVGQLWGNETSFKITTRMFLVVVIAYSVILVIYKAGYFPRSICLLFFAAIFIFESYNNVSLYLVNPAKRNETFNKSFKESFHFENKIKDNAFYRVKTHSKRYYNSWIGCIGYNNIAHRSGFIELNYMKTIANLGYGIHWQEVFSNGGTRLTDALLSNKYQIYSTHDGFGKQSHSKSIYQYSNKSTNKVDSIYKLSECLPMGLLLSKESYNISEVFPQEMGRIEMQHYISKAIFNEDVVTNYTPKKSINKSNNKWNVSSNDTIVYKLNIGKEQTIYIDCYNGFHNNFGESYYDSMQVNVNGKSILSSYPTTGFNGFFSLGDFKDTTVEIIIKMKKSIHCSSFGIFGIDVSRLNELCNEAQGVGLQEKKNGLIGNCDIDEAKTCFVSLPYQDNYSVRINGKKVKYHKAFSGFISFDVPQGHNKIKISYIPKGLPMGIFIGLIGIMLLVLSIKYRKKLEEYLIFDTAAKYILMSASAITVLCVYVLPMIVNILAK